MLVKHGLPAFLCACFSVKAQDNFKFSDQPEADFFCFGFNYCNSISFAIRKTIKKRSVPSGILRIGAGDRT